MGKSNRPSRKPARLDGPRRSVPTPGPSALSPSSRVRSSRQKWAARFGVAILSPLFLLGVVEAGLRLAGYGYSTNFFVKMEGAEAYTVNEHFARQFYPGNAAEGKSHPFVMPARKPAETMRIFVLGESAALGTPNPSFGFARILELMLRNQYPEKKFEVINAAMRGINSHIVLPIARDCVEHQPDLFIVYMGNNEVVGLHAPGPDSGYFNRNLTFIRLSQHFKSMRLGQWLMAALERKAGASAADHDMTFFRDHRIAMDDHRRQAVYENFRANLEDTCKVLSASGARVILSTLAVNLKDFPPLGSLHRADLGGAEKTRWESDYAKGATAEAAGQYQEAVEHYLAAARADDHFAELQFRLGRCCYELGRFEEARERFALARDRDALPFRGDRFINEIVRKVAADLRGGRVNVVDAERAFAENEMSDHRIPGSNLFYEHVHLRFDGDYLLARTFYPAVVAGLGSALGKPAGPPDRMLSRQECADRLALTGWDELQMDLSMVRMRAHPPFLDQLDHDREQLRAEQKIQSRRASVQSADLEQAGQVYRAALEREPNDWQMHHNFGMFCFMTGDFTNAARHLEIEVKIFPKLVPGRVAFGSALAKAGRNQEALLQFNEVLRIDPNHARAREAVSALAFRRGARGPSDSVGGRGQSGVP